MYLFQQRELASSFSGRNVVLESYGIKNKRDDLVLNITIDFGIQGAIRRHKVIEVAGRKVEQVIRDMKSYQDTLLEIVDVLEEYKHWVMFNPTETQFTRVVQGPSPLMFNGVRNTKYIRLEIFGHGLHDLALQFEHRETGSVQYLLDRIDEVAEWVRGHLKSMDNVRFADTFKGAKA